MFAYEEAAEGIAGCRGTVDPQTCATAYASC